MPQGKEEFEIEHLNPWRVPAVSFIVSTLLRKPVVDGMCVCVPQKLTRPQPPE